MLIVFSSQITEISWHLIDFQWAASWANDYCAKVWLIIVEIAIGYLLTKLIIEATFNSSSARSWTMKWMNLILLRITSIHLNDSFNRLVRQLRRLPFATEHQHHGIWPTNQIRFRGDLSSNPIATTNNLRDSPEQAINWVVFKGLCDETISLVGKFWMRCPLRDLRSSSSWGEVRIVYDGRTT